MTLNVYNQSGEVVGTLDLPAAVFGLKWNADLVHQAVVAQMANARKPWAHAKTRGEVRGGGKKPWRQKGTGRARHGSIRSPIWKGGGVTFGPRNERSYEQKINKKMKRQALFSALSQKAKDAEVVVVDALSFPQVKTKEASRLFTTFAEKKIFSRFRGKRKNDLLVVLGAADQAAVKAIRNIPYTKVVQADSLNVVDVLSYRYLFMPKAAVGVVEKTFKRNAKVKMQNAK